MGSFHLSSNTDEISKELTKACEKFKPMINKTDSIPYINANCLRQGEIQWCLSSPNIVPPEGRWNQSIGEHTFYLSWDASICIRKLNLRWPKDAKNTPTIKLWVGKVTRPNTLYYLTWCERGFMHPPTDRSQKVIHNHTNLDDLEGDELPEIVDTIPIKDVKLEELSFLKEFISPEIAEELGW